MSKNLKKTMKLLAKAQPSSGCRQETLDESKRILNAIGELGAAMLIESGMPEDRARYLASQTFGGEAGRLLIDLAFRGGTDGSR